MLSEIICKSHLLYTLVKCSLIFFVNMKVIARLNTISSMTGNETRAWQPRLLLKSMIITPVQSKWKTTITYRYLEFFHSIYHNRSSISKHGYLLPLTLFLPDVIVLTTLEKFAVEQIYSNINSFWSSLMNFLPDDIASCPSNNFFFNSLLSHVDLWRCKFTSVTEWHDTCHNLLTYSIPPVSLSSFVLLHGT